MGMDNALRLPVIFVERYFSSVTAPLADGPLTPIAAIGTPRILFVAYDSSVSVRR